MNTLIIYESMYGNTHTVAQHLASGLASAGPVKVVPVAEGSGELIEWADLVVVGGPTHIHGMTSSASRKSAKDAAAKPDSELTLDPDAEGPGIRDWFHGLTPVTGKPATAFDTRLHGPSTFTGRASRGIAKRLRQHGFELIAEPESFLVTKQTTLEEGEADRATEWAEHLSKVVSVG